MSLSQIVVGQYGECLQLWNEKMGHTNQHMHTLSTDKATNARGYRQAESLVRNLEAECSNYVCSYKLHSTHQKGITPIHHISGIQYMPIVKFIKQTFFTMCIQTIYHRFTTVAPRDRRQIVRYQTQIQ